jgi:hypothetical protein
MEDLNRQGPVSAKGFGQPEPTPAAAGAPGTEPSLEPGQPAGNINLEPGQGTPQGVNPPAIPQDKGSAPATDRFISLDDIEDPLIREHLEKLLGPKEKAMQAAFTKKTQAIAAERQKIEAYDNFLQNPQAVIRQVAQQYGLQIVDGNGNPQGTAQGMIQGAAQSPLSNPDYQPQTWGQLEQDLAASLIPRIAQEITSKIGPMLGPLYQNVEQITSRNIETQLDTIDKDWRLYEDEVKLNMRNHPTLLKDPSGIKKLYLLSVPEEVITGRATQTALTKIHDKGEALKAGGKTQVSRSTVPAPKKVSTFEDAVQIAKAQLARQT